jgi:hypothetical protein
MATRALVFPNSVKELVSSCLSFYEENKEKMSSESVREKRRKLSSFVEGFHKDCGTLTPSVAKRIEDLKNGTGLVLMTAHQPNLFAYSGVFRKATLSFFLAKTLEQTVKVPVVNFFGIADQDFTDDRWVRSCQLPSVLRSEGTFSIDMKLPEKLMLNRVAKPSADVLMTWKAEIEKWFYETVKSVDRLCKTLHLLEVRRTLSDKVFLANLEFLWSIVEDCYERSRNYSDFNAFVMSKIMNEVWGYDTLFARFSECQQIFLDEFHFLLSRFDDYSRLLKETQVVVREEPVEVGASSGVSVQEPLLVPFWYHCSCGSKVKLFFEEVDGYLFGSGECVRCREHFNLKFGPKNSPDISEVASQISARAISMCSVFFKGLVPSCYVGGVGGTRYLLEAEHVAKGLGLLFPPTTVWRPRDKYLGIGQMEAVLELKRICESLGTEDLPSTKRSLDSRISEIQNNLGKLEDSKRRMFEKLKEHPNDEKLKENIKRISISQTKMARSCNLSVMSHELRTLENVSRVLTLIPSIIDYAVNIGLKETSDQWIRHLSENGSLSSSVSLDSILSRTAKLRALSGNALECS